MDHTVIIGGGLDENDRPYVEWDWADGQSFRMTTNEARIIALLLPKDSPVAHVIRFQADEADALLDQSTAG